jgi:hypothetical protein
VLALGRHRGPRVVISGKVIVVTAVYGETAATGPRAHGLPVNGDLVAWRSTDGGRSWSAPVVVNDAPGSAREGLHAIAAANQGELAAVWLDLRSPGTRLYGAYSNDAGATWSKNVLIYQSPGGTICQCCDPSVASSGKHQFEVMFRNVVGDARDMYLTTWDLYGQVSNPRKVGIGSWNINACPMDGGGVARRGGKVVTAWRREKTVYLDEPGQPETALGNGKDVALTSSVKGPYVAWSGSSCIELHRPGVANASCIASPSNGGFPALVSLSDGSILVAWEQEGKIQLKIVD